MKNKFLKNTSWIIGGQIIKMLISLVISILTARYLGPSNYGVINYVNSYIAFFTSLVGLGLNGVIIYEFINYKDEEGKILGTAVCLRLLAGIISSAIFLVLVHYTDEADHVIMMVAILQTIQLPFLAFDTVNYWYQSKLLSKYSVIVQTIAYIITSSYKVYLLATKKSIAWFAFAISLDIILIGVMYILIYYYHRTQQMKFSVKVAKRLLKNCGPFILANMMVVIYGQMDKIMIKQMLNSTELVGLYSAAIAICNMIGFIPCAILDSGRPVVMEAKNKDELLYQLRTRQLFSAIFWVCVLYSLGITVFSKIAIVLLYGKAYTGANICLKIAVWFTAFSYLGSARNLWLICEKRNNYVFIFSCMGALTNLILNFILIPIWNINGAAIATLITQISANMIYPSFFKDTKTYSLFAIDSILLKNINLKETVQKVKTHMFNSNT